MKWIKIISRNSTPLQWSAQIHQIKDGIEIDSLYWRYNKRLIIKYATPLTHLFAYTGEALEESLRDFIAAENEAITSIQDELEKIIEEDLNLTSGNSLEDVRHYYERFRYEMGQMIMAYDFAHITRSVLEQKLGKEKLAAIDSEVMQAYKDTTFIQENRKLQDVRRTYRSGALGEKELESRASELANKFGFLHAEYIGKAWTAENYLKEVTAEYTVEKESNATDSQPTNDLDDYSLWLIETIQRWIYIFDESKNALVRANWALRETLHALDIEEQPILNCTEEEFYHWLESRNLPPADVLNSREKYYAASLWEGTINELSTQSDVERIIKEEEIAEFIVVEKGVKELKGQAAFKGKVHGKVRLVFSPADAEKVNEGDILVASMTTPGMIQGMRKAAAFVTDEGGVLCHAAIVAREFKKPCVIGTKNATKILTDDTEVEVDANNGIVKILESK